MARHQKKRFRRTAAIVASLALMAGLAPGQQAQADDTVLSVDFSDGTYAPLVASGDPVLAVVELDDNQVLSVQGRTADYVGVSTPEGLLEPGETYDVSVDVLLAEGLPAAEARLVGVPGYTWIGNTVVSADGWTAIEGQWTVPADPEESPRVYVGAADIAGHLSFYTDRAQVLVDGEKA